MKRRGDDSRESRPAERRLSPTSATRPPTGIDEPVGCDRCPASCCRLEVLLLTDAGVPQYLTATDAWGGTVMRRLEDGWCAALDRGSMRCSIYGQRPWVCRELQMGGEECRAIRAADGVV